MRKVALLVLAMMASLGVSNALAADRVHATVACRAAGEKLTYDCAIRLTNARTGAALDNARVTIAADMPSMPMAHNVPPVTATATGAPGEYQAHVRLEMHGDWALRLTVAGALRDEVVEVRNFGEEGSGPPSRKSPKANGHSKH
jgi:hypothetical protein